MKKIVLSIIFILILSIIPSALAKAEGDDNSKDSTEELQQILDDNSDDLNNLYDYINNLKLDSELKSQLDPVSYIKSYMKEGKGNISFDTISKAVISLLFKEVRSVLALALSIITIAILCTLIKSLQDAFTTKGISEVAFYACYVILIIILSRSFLISIKVAKDVIVSISNFMNALLPILVSMITLSGGIVSATTLDPVVMTTVLIVPKIYTKLIIPLVLITFVLQFANNLSTEHKIDNLCKSLKKVTLWIQGIFVTIFIGILTIRGITGSTIDAVTLKTTKFAVDNFIPIVGKSFSDAISSVAAYSLIIKNAVSGIGLIVIIFIIIYPVIKLVLMSFIYKLSQALVEPVSDKRITACIGAAGDGMVTLLSCVLSVSLMFFVLLAIMAEAGKFIVGA